MHTPGAFRALLKEAPIPPYKSACENYYLILECHRNEALYPTIPPACLAKALPTNLPWPFILAPSTPPGHTRRPCQSQFLSPRILLTTALRGGCHNPPRQTQAAAICLNDTCVWLYGPGSAHCPMRQIKCQILGRGAATHASSREGGSGLTGVPPRLEATRLLGAASRVYEVPCASGALLC